MSENETPKVEDVVEGTAEEIGPDFSFTVIKKGEVLNVNAEGNNVTVDDIYSTVCVLKRNIEAEQTAAMVQQATAAALQQLQKQATGQRESGLVVPK